MAKPSNHHILSVGWEHSVIDRIWRRVDRKIASTSSHLAHPKYVPQNWPRDLSRERVHFFRQALDQAMPDPDPQLLASLEGDGVPTIHNMILSDRIVSKLSYEDALRYSTFLTKRLMEALSSIKPSIVIGCCDYMHGSLAFAVCRYLGIPWFYFHFGVIPSGTACFCNRLTPASRVDLSEQVGTKEKLEEAEAALGKFESREIRALAYVAPKPRSVLGKAIALPKKIKPLISTLQRGRHGPFRKFSESATSYSVWAVAAYYWRGAVARRALAKTETIAEPPEYPYVFFGLHMQPESTIDVWAHYFSNQMWVIELLARSIPPTHRLLVKIHKSDVSNHTRQLLDRMASLPGVTIVEPFANTLRCIENADLIVSIQGTTGLEAALSGKPVIMLGESPNVLFDSVSRIGEITDLPALIKRKLSEPKPARSEIVNRYAEFMAPFMPASNNYWDQAKSKQEIDGYVELVSRLEKYVS